MSDMTPAVLYFVARQPNKYAVCVSWRKNPTNNTYCLFADTRNERYSVTLWNNAPVSDLAHIKAIAILANEFAFLNTSTVNARSVYAMACNLIRRTRYAQSRYHESAALADTVVAAFDNALSVLAESYPTIVADAKKSIL